MESVLALVGFTDDELRQYRKEIILLAELIGVDERQCREAAEQLPLNYDLSYESIRRLLKLLLETILKDLAILTGENKQPVVLQAAVPMPVVAAAAMEELNPYIRVSFSEYLLIYLSGVLFNVFGHFCSAGERSCGRCGLNLSREKLFRNPRYPRPEKIVTCLGYCDEMYKTGEFLSMTYGVGHSHLKGMAGLDFDSQKDYLCRGLENFLREHSDGSEQEIESVLRTCNDKFLEISLLLNRINRILAKEAHSCVTFNETSLLNVLNLVYLSDRFKEGKSILKTFIRELRQKRKNRDYVLENPIRIGCMHLPFSNPLMDRCFRQNGAAVIVSSFYQPAQEGGKADNEYERCIRNFYGDRTPGNIDEKAKHLDRLIEEYRLDAFLFGQFENDRALGGDQLMIMKRLKKQDKIHFMTMNNWAVLQNRDIMHIESLAEILKEKKATL